MQDTFIEYLVKKRNTAQTALLKLLIIVAALIAAAASLLFSGYLGPLGMLGPVMAAGICYGAYHLVISQNIEYEYAVTNGDLDVDKITARRKRKRLITVDCKTVEAFGRYRPEEHRNKSYQTKIFACDHPQNPDLWHCVVRLQKSGLTLLVFNANQKMLDGVKPYLPRPIMHQAFRVGQ